MKSFFAGRRAKYILLTLALLGIAIAVINFRARALPPVQILPPTTPVASQTVSFIDRLIPRTWGWAWRLRSMVSGTRRNISLTSSIVDLKALTQERLEATLAAPPTFSDATGLHVWIADAEKLEVLRSGWSADKLILVAPRTTSAHEVGSSQSSTSTVLIGSKLTETGLFIEYLPRVSATSADLFAMIRMTEPLTNYVDNTISVRTNVSLVARLQIPKGKGALLINTNLTATGTYYGILLSSSIE